MGGGLEWGWTPTTHPPPTATYCQLVTLTTDFVSLPHCHIDDCQFVSEKLAEILDEKDPIKEKYYLEVSSPGIDRPLKKDKDFEANYGKKVDIQFFAPFDGHKELTGILLSHTETEIDVKRIVKGREEKNPIKIERKLIAMIRPHIDF